MRNGQCYCFLSCFIGDVWSACLFRSLYPSQGDKSNGLETAGDAVGFYVACVARSMVGTYWKQTCCGTVGLQEEAEAQRAELLTDTAKNCPLTALGDRTAGQTPGPGWELGWNQERPGWRWLGEGQWEPAAGLGVWGSSERGGPAR